MYKRQCLHGRQKHQCKECGGSQIYEPIHRTAGLKLAELPDVLEQWDLELNPSAIDPSSIAAGSSKRYYWRCPKGPDHIWDAPVGRRTRGIGCPFCANVRVSVTNSLATKFPSIAEQWHPSMNGDLTRSDVMPMYNIRKVWWKCPKGAEHEWEARINKRTKPKGTGFSYCDSVRIRRS